MPITLTQPSIGSTNWGTDVNTNWQNIQDALNGVTSVIKTIAVPIRNETGTTLPAGPVRITGYNVTNAAFLVSMADADGNIPAQLLITSNLATSSNGIGYIAADFTSTLDTSVAAIGAAVYLASGGGLTLTAPSGADKVVQAIGRVQTQAASGVISGFISTPTALGTSFLKDQAVTNAKLAAGAVSLSTGVSGILPVANGGTSASSAASARTNLGAAASGANADITSLTALSTPLSISQGGTNSGAALNNNRLVVSSGGAVVEAPAMTDGQVVVGKTGFAPQQAAMSGDATISNTGAVTIANLAVTNAKIANSTIDLMAKVTNTLPVANGGTGKTSITSGALLTGNGASVPGETTVDNSTLEISGTTLREKDAGTTLAKLEARARPVSNSIINGGFDFFQRQPPGTATAYSASDDVYAPDRWYTLCETNQTNTSSRARSSNVATIVTATTHGLISGDLVTITGLGGTGYNAINVSITFISATSFTYSNTGSNEGTTSDTAGRIGTITLMRTSGEGGSENAVRMKQLQQNGQRIGLTQIIEGRDSRVLRARTIRLQARVRCSKPGSGGSNPTKIRIAILEWIGSEDTGITSDVVNDWSKTAYLAPIWQGSTAYSTGGYARPITSNNYFYECTTAGTSGSSQPTWPTIVGNTVSDGSVVWTCRAGNFFIASNLLPVATDVVDQSADSWTSLSVTGILSSTLNNLIVMIWTESAAFQGVTVDITQAGLYDGDQARDWLPRPIQQELALCHRYCYQISADATTPRYFGGGLVQSLTSAYYTGGLPVPMRTIPTVTMSAATAVGFYDGTTSANSNGSISNYYNDNYGMGVRDGMILISSSTSGFAVGRSCYFYVNTGVGNYIRWDAEL